jgi:diaminopimelate decarboxylase
VRSVSEIPVSMPSQIDFGHAPETIRNWKRLASEALEAGAGTPFYLFAVDPVRERLSVLEALDFGLPVTHWLSTKTQPVAPLLRWWREAGRPVEVVSEFEYHAARAEGFATDRILINGPAKHRWLPSLAEAGMRVNFDSSGELEALLPLARQLGWRCGLRICTREEFDPEHSAFATQFGFTPDEAREVLPGLLRNGPVPEVLHLHLRTNVSRAGIYASALTEALALARETGWQPRVVDLGGGLPPPHTTGRDGKAFDTGMDLPDFAAQVRRILGAHPFVEELWLENGRFVTASSGIFVLKVLDRKQRRGLRQLICDGGRTMNALVSNWEQHRLEPLEERSGEGVETVVHGPTCMAWDQIARQPLPSDLSPGDHLVWFEAGAYHLAWETRFSHGLAAVWWHDEQGLHEARGADSFERWWGGWHRTPPDRSA